MPLEATYLAWVDFARHRDRSTAGFRNWVTADGSARPLGRGRLQGRKRALPPLRLLRLPLGAPHADLPRAEGAEDHIGVSVVHPDMLDDGWTFAPTSPAPPATGCTARVSCARSTPAPKPDVSGRVTVPVLWDTQRGPSCRTKAPRSSACSIRPSTASPATADDYWPEDLRDGDRAVNDRIYDTVNNGVYRAGFATTQEPMTRRWPGLRDARLAGGPAGAATAT
jgi:glutathionyl-hydroquinone reductase